MRRAISFLLLLIFTVPVEPLPSHGQESLRYDRTAIFKTHVPHRNSQIGAGAVPNGGVGGIGTATTFTGTSYSILPPVTPTTTTPQAEEHIAVDPNNSATLVAAVSDFAVGGYNTTKWTISRDNGANWAESYVPLDPTFGFLATSDGNFWLANSDPTVAIDRSGNVYLANLYLDAFDNGNGLYVSVAPLSSGPTFTVGATYPVATNPSASTTIQEDKPWLTADNSTNSSTVGSVYICWSRFVGNSDSIVFSRSVDHAVTWAPPLRISPSAQDGAVQGCQVAVGPGGEVYVAYEVFYVGGQRQHLMAKSVNGGLTFSTPHAITPVFNEINFKSRYRKNSFPSLTVSLLDGYVYAVYAVQSNRKAGADAMFIASTDGGASFSSPQVINDVSTGQQFFPAITTDENGVIHISWFDTRNSGGNAALYDVFATYSKDNGTTFAPNARVTPALINAGNATFIGDYACVAAAMGFAHPVWTSGGFNNGSLQTATLQLP
jgi:hypothetical protein